jgi:hypothetical protein
MRRLPNQSLGRGFNGNFVMTEVLASIKSEGSTRYAEVRSSCGGL